MSKFERLQLVSAQEQAPPGIADIPHYDLRGFFDGLRDAVQLEERQRNPVVPWSIISMYTLFRFHLPPHDFVMKVDKSLGLSNAEIALLVSSSEVRLDNMGQLSMLPPDPLVPTWNPSERPLMEQAAAANHANSLTPKFADKPLAIWMKDGMRVAFSAPTINAPFYNYQDLMVNAFTGRGRPADNPGVRQLQDEFFHALKIIEDAGIMVDKVGRNFALLESGSDISIKLIDLDEGRENFLYKPLPGSLHP